ncbi:MAG: mannose-1-phosphate guanylyltransferase [Bdellovibrionota bacterium]|jgi:mannose-1-phosphate guanylyltransferase
MERELDVVIMAGGQSTRFWPVARRAAPKHFLAMDAKLQSFVVATVNRAKKLTDKSNILIVGHAVQTDLMRQHVPDIKFLGEPKSCNTAAALGLSALHIRRKNRDAVMVALPADHAVLDEERFRKTIIDGVRMALSYDVLVTIGIIPTFPHTDYGYIRRGDRIGDECCTRGAYMVSRFFEKPSLQRARLYFGSDEFYWNSGMFIWRPDVLLDAIKEYMPDLYSGLMKIDQALDTPQEAQILEEVYATLPVTSIDFGVMEHAKNCVVVDAEPFGWDDVGAWDAWAEHFESDEDGNTALGDVMFMDSSGCIVHSEKSFVAVNGVDDLVVINTSDALLVCQREKLSDIKKIASELRRRGKTELL